MQVLAVVAERLSQLDDNLASDIIYFLGPLERKKDVAAGDLASLMTHLDIRPEDSAEITNMKGGVRELRVLMDVLLLIKEAKEVVTYLKASGLAANLSKKVLQECETRWNSLHTMLTSVLEMYDEVRCAFPLPELYCSAPAPTLTPRRPAPRPRNAATSVRRLKGPRRSSILCVYTTVEWVA